MSVPQGLLPFKVIPDSDKSILTSFAGLPLVIETMRALKVHNTVDNYLVIKKRQSGKYTESDYVESFIALLASGGECLDDFDRLQSDRGLKELGLNIPSSESARFFLYAFHDEEKLKDRPEKGAFIPQETQPLQNLFKVQENIIKRGKDGRDVVPLVPLLDFANESLQREAHFPEQSMQDPGSPIAYMLPKWQDRRIASPPPIAKDPFLLYNSSVLF